MLIQPFKIIHLDIIKTPQKNPNKQPLYHIQLLRMTYTNSFN